VRAPAEAGRANAAVVRVVAAALGLPADAVRIASGSSSLKKTLEIDGIDLDTLRARVARLRSGREEISQPDRSSSPSRPAPRFARRSRGPYEPALPRTERRPPEVERADVPALDLLLPSSK
jgi:hypothetical protein